MTGSPERQMILKMLSEGRIGAEEAEELLAALDRAERGDPGRGEGPRGPRGQPEIDLGELGRGIRDAVKGLADGLEKLTRTVPWGKDLGDWFRSTLGSAKTTVERAVVCPPECTGDRILVKGTNGTVKIQSVSAVRPSGRARITAWGPDETAARRVAEGVRVFTSVTDGALEISCPTSAGERGSHAEEERFQVDLELEVPETAALGVNTSTGNITICDHLGELRAKTASGSIELSRIRGRAWVTTASGSVRGDQSGADRLEVDSSSGDVVLTLAPAAGATTRITTASGDVVLRLAPTTRVRVEATTTSGEVTVRAPLRVEELGRSRFVGVQGEADSTVRLASSSGDLRIESPGA